MFLMRRAIGSRLHAERRRQILLARSRSETRKRTGFAIAMLGSFWGGGFVLAAFGIDV
jgi:hypothetical protein